MKKITSKIQFAWHIHHDVLVEPLFEPIKDRIAYIKSNKPTDEINLRLRLLKLVKGELPIPLYLQEAYAKWQETYVKRQEADVKWQEADVKWQEAYAKWQEADVKRADAKWQETYVKRQEAYAKWQETDAKRQEAYVKWQEADVKWQEAYAKKINVLHKKECPRCPWDGKTIFSKS